MAPRADELNGLTTPTGTRDLPENLPRTSGVGEFFLWCSAATRNRPVRWREDSTAATRRRDRIMPIFLLTFNDAASMKRSFDKNVGFTDRGCAKLVGCSFKKMSRLSAD